MSHLQKRTVITGGQTGQLFQQICIVFLFGWWWRSG